MVNNASAFSRLETMDTHQLEMQQHQQETDKRIDEVFRRLDEGNAKPKQVCSTMDKFMMPILSCPT